MLIQIGSEETLLSDATRLAEAAGSADVDVTLEIWPHMIHAWPVWNAALEDGRRALARAGEFIHARVVRDRRCTFEKTQVLRTFCPESTAYPGKSGFRRR
jgi:hypothetical protein